MKTLKSILLLTALATATFIMPACKAKKEMVITPPASKPPMPPDPPARNTEPAKETPPPAPPAPPKPTPPNYNFSNIQFEFNSGILKTDSYPILDKAIAEMKKDASVKFVLNGNSSAEGSAEHNQTLSVERANSVKLYLTNSGISGANLSVKGYGETMPIAKGDDEASRALNRRVEIKKQ